MQRASNSYTAESEKKPAPRCKWCGSENLFPDHAGYYYDAEREDGAPLFCLDHKNHKPPAEKC